MRICPLWLWHFVGNGWERVWSELNASEDSSEDMTEMPPIEELAHRTHLSRETVKRAIAGLAELGALRLDRRRNEPSLYRTIAQPTQPR